MTQVIEGPCKGCKEREIGCHGRCPAYAWYCAKKAEVAAKRGRETVGRSMAIDSCYRRPIHKHKVPPLKIEKERSKK